MSREFCFVSRDFMLQFDKKCFEVCLDLMLQFDELHDLLMEELCTEGTCLLLAVHSDDGLVNDCHIVCLFFVLIL